MPANTRDIFKYLVDENDIVSDIKRLISENKTKDQIINIISTKRQSYLISKKIIEDKYDTIIKQKETKQKDKIKESMKKMISRKIKDLEQQKSPTDIEKCFGEEVDKIATQILEVYKTQFSDKNELKRYISNISEEIKYQFSSIIIEYQKKMQEWETQTEKEFSEFQKNKQKPETFTKNFISNFFGTFNAIYKNNIGKLLIEFAVSQLILGAIKPVSADSITQGETYFNAKNVDMNPFYGVKADDSSTRVYQNNGTTIGSSTLSAVEGTGGILKAQQNTFYLAKRHQTTNQTEKCDEIITTNGILNRVYDSMKNFQFGNRNEMEKNFRDKVLATQQKKLVANGCSDQSNKVKVGQFSPEQFFKDVNLEVLSQQKVTQQRRPKTTPQTPLNNRTPTTTTKDPNNDSWSDYFYKILGLNDENEATTNKDINQSEQTQNNTEAPEYYDDDDNDNRQQNKNNTNTENINNDNNDGLLSYITDSILNNKGTVIFASLLSAVLASELITGKTIKQNVKRLFEKNKPNQPNTEENVPLNDMATVINLEQEDNETNLRSTRSFTGSNSGSNSTIYI